MCVTWAACPPATAAGRPPTGCCARDNLQELTPSDIARLVQDIGVTTIVDLRSTAELTSEGPAPLDTVAGVRHAHHPVLPEQGAATDVVADVLLTRADQDRSRYPGDPVTGHYLGYLEDRPDQVVGRAAQHRQLAGRGAGALRGGQGPHRRGGGGGADRGRGPGRGGGGRLRGDGGAHRADRRPAAPVADLRGRHQQQGRPVPPAAAGDHGGVPRAGGRPARRGHRLAGRARLRHRGPGACWQRACASPERAQPWPARP